MYFNISPKLSPILKKLNLCHQYVFADVEEDARISTFFRKFSQMLRNYHLCFSLSIGSFCMLLDRTCWRNLMFLWLYLLMPEHAHVQYFECLLRTQLSIKYC